MLAGIRRTLMSPVVGLIAVAVAVALAAALGVVAQAWNDDRAAYEARISALMEASGRVEAGLRRTLATCQVAPQGQSAPSADDMASETTAPNTRQLLERQPEGIDACARMESADEAVLSSLPK